MQLFNPPHLFVEITPSHFLALEGKEGLEMRLERLENGRLTPTCREQLIRSLGAFLQRNSWQARPKAFCAVGARGFSLRRLTLPAAAREEFQRLLLLQIEREFPLSPEELAWGWLPLPHDLTPAHCEAASQEILVAAVKKEVMDEYLDLLAGCGLSPIFTLGAWARRAVCPPFSGPYAILDIGSSHSELIAFQNGVPDFIRILPWGDSEFSGWMGSSSGGEAGAEPAYPLDRDASKLVEGSSQARAPLPPGIDTLSEALLNHPDGKKLFLTGRGVPLQDLAPRLAKDLNHALQCEPVEIQPGPGRSAATLGLRAFLEKNGTLPGLVIQAQKSKSSERMQRPAPWRWVVLAVGLVLAALAGRYAEAFLLKPGLSKKMAEIKAFRAKLPQIDQELSFLNYIKTNQPPCLDAMAVIASAVPPGARLESLAMSRRGDLSLRITLSPPQQSIEFRSKLMDSGFFSTVVLEEQTPTQDKQKLKVRLSAQWKPFATREMRLPPATRPASGPEGPPNLPPGMPSGMMPGMSVAMPSGAAPPMPWGAPPAASANRPPGLSPGPVGDPVELSQPLPPP